MRLATKLHTLPRCLDEALVDRGPAEGAVGDLVSRISSLPLVDGSAKGKIGIWESTPGHWPRAQAAAEFCLIIGGAGRFVQDGAADIELSDGAMVYFPENTAGTWIITDTIRKIYVLFS